jgi:hypothetical protein
VRQQAGFLEHPLGDVVQVVEGGFEAHGGERFPGGLVAQLRLLAEGEQRFLAAHGGTVAGDLQHLVHGQVGRLQLARHLGERAVVADVAAQVGERNEHLA